MSDDPFAALLALAATQRGAFTWKQARELGWTESAATVARRHDWKRLGRGVYVHAFVWEGLAERERHLCTAMGRVLAGRGWHVARRTAAVAHGLPLLGKIPAVPQLVRDRSGVSSKANNRHERLSVLPEKDRQVVENTPATTRARTAVDIARDESFMSAVVVADAVLRAGTSRQELKETAARVASWKRGFAAVRVAEFADGLSESVLESISRVRIDERGLPRPELQVLVYLGDELIARVDFLWRRHNAVGLADGAMKYESREQVMAEKWQVERLEDIGLEVARWGWDSAYRANGDLEYKVRRALDRGSRQLLDPRVRFVTTTIAQNVLTNERLAARRSG